jgi:Na+/H+-dicarboxylate symporter
MFTDWPAFWGFLGAIIYAAPKMTTCLFAEAGSAHLRRCLIEGLTALLIGTVAAAAFQPWLGGYLHATTPQDTKAMSAMIGMLANTVAPGVIKLLADTAIARIRGGQ